MIYPSLPHQPHNASPIFPLLFSTIPSPPPFPRHHSLLSSHLLSTSPPLNPPSLYFPSPLPTFSPPPHWVKICLECNFKIEFASWILVKPLKKPKSFECFKTVFTGRTHFYSINSD